MKSIANLKPVSVVRTTEIEGQTFPMHEFPAGQWGEIIKPLRESLEDKDADEISKSGLEVIIIGLEGAEYAPTQEDRKKLTVMLSNGVLREYMHRLCQLNDFGIDAVQAAEKNYAAAQSNATKQS